VDQGHGLYEGYGQFDGHVGVDGFEGDGYDNDDGGGGNDGYEAAAGDGPGGFGFNDDGDEDGGGGGPHNDGGGGGGGGGDDGGGGGGIGVDEGEDGMFDPIADGALFVNLTPEENAQACPESGRGRRDWYVRRLDGPIAFVAGVRVGTSTPRQEAFSMLEHKVVYAMGRNLMDSLLHQKAQGGSLPESNCLIPTWTLLKSVLGIEDYSQYVRHVCQDECHIWEKEQPGHVRDVGEECPVCKKKRFRVLRGGKLEPVRVSSTYLVEHIQEHVLCPIYT
jgi:hypothetical protein